MGTDYRRYFVYNFIRIHRTLRVPPAMQAGVADACGMFRIWWRYSKRPNPKSRIGTTDGHERATMARKEKGFDWAARPTRERGRTGPKGAIGPEGRRGQPADARITDALRADLEAMRSEAQIQFRRIAQLQAQLDVALKEMDRLKKSK